MAGRVEVEQLAAALLDQWGVVGPPVPVEQIALWSGVQIVRSNADWSQSGFLMRDGTSAVIGINSRNAPKRQRFTIAHELGHWKLHEGKLIIDQSVMRINKRDDVSSQATDQEEIEANQFAAELLMPRRFMADAIERMFRSDVSSRDELVATLAREFEVSNDAMGWRLINLGVLSN